MVRPTAVFPRSLLLLILLLCCSTGLCCRTKARQLAHRQPALHHRRRARRVARRAEQEVRPVLPLHCLWGRVAHLLDRPARFQPHHVERQRLPLSQAKAGQGSASKDARGWAARHRRSVPQASVHPASSSEPALIRGDTPPAGLGSCQAMSTSASDGSSVRLSRPSPSSRSCPSCASIIPRCATQCSFSRTQTDDRNCSFPTALCACLASRRPRNS
jgi:hypothetical protein